MAEGHDCLTSLLQPHFRYSQQDQSVNAHSYDQTLPTGGLRILFISGSESVVYTSETTDKSFTTLTDSFGQEGYECETIEGYGHLDCWMGKDAHRDVYPTVLRHAIDCMK